MISSEEINFLVGRYFQECGFDHSYYSFNAESSIDTSNINGAQIPPGALITLLQKGLLYIQLEKEINSSHKNGQSFKSQLTLFDAALLQGSSFPQKSDKAPESTNDSPSVQLDPSNSVLLAEHSKDVLCCAWTPDGRFLATGSSDNTAIIWDMSNPASITHAIMNHSKPEQGAGQPLVQHRVSSLEWSTDSSFLATGCSDGAVRVWDVKGTLIHEISCGQGALHVVHYDPTGKKIVCCTQDSNVVIIDTNSGEILKNVNVKHGAILDATWRNEHCFAVGCDDGLILIFDSSANDGEPQPLTGHSETVNGLVWNKSGEFLASCSDDKTVRIWHNRSAEDEEDTRDEPLTSTLIEDIILNGHGSPVYAVRWSEHDILASASFDKTIRLWDVSGQCLHVLASHTMPIYSLCFTPDGGFLASGSDDQSIKFWKVDNGQLICNCIGSQSVLDLQCDKEGQYIAACFVQGNVLVIPLSNLPLHPESVQ